MLLDNILLQNNKQYLNNKINKQLNKYTVNKQIKVNVFWTYFEIDFLMLSIGQKQNQTNAHRSKMDLEKKNLKKKKNCFW